MPEVSTMWPHLHPVSPQPTVGASSTAVRQGNSTTILPQDNLHMEVHTMVIVAIFCVVCFLLLLAFFYTFCFHCSIGSSLKDSRAVKRCSADREDATYKCTSSENLSVANIV